MPLWSIYHWSADERNKKWNGSQINTFVNEKQ